jgi:hypothetical protein
LLRRLHARVGLRESAPLETGPAEDGPAELVQVVNLPAAVPEPAPPSPR